jgi:ectoine hydroxylase-related dioxygenase (phytanoyl-CoA dioxygenase family)
MNISEATFHYQPGKEELYRRTLTETGFLQFKNFLGSPELAELVQSQQVAEKRIIQEGVRHIYGVPIFFGTDTEGLKVIQRLPFTSSVNSYIKDYILGEKMKAISALLGAEFRIGEKEYDGVVMNHYLNHKQSSYYRIGWHTDSGRDFWSFKRPSQFYNTGIYLDDSPLQKGGLRILPGTHKQSLSRFMFRKFHFLDHSADLQEYPVIAEAGDLTIHDGRLWHRVAQASVSGVESRRRVMYVPFIKGKVREKNESSSMPLLHRLYSAYFSFKKRY